MKTDPSVTSDLVREFVAQKRLAVAGASRSGQKLGNAVLRALKERGYETVPIHPEASELEGLACAPSLAAVAGRVDGLVVVTRPSETAKLVAEAAAAGIRRVWLSQQTSTPEIVREARERGLSVVHGYCLLMFLPGTRGIHRFHRGLSALLRKLPPAPVHA